MATERRDVARFPAPDARAEILERRRTLKMARSAHAYVRGSTAQFYDWLAEADRGLVPAGPPVWICGDCHLGNLGPLADAAGRVRIRIRDLDHGPRVELLHVVADEHALGAPSVAMTRGHHDVRRDERPRAAPVVRAPDRDTVSIVGGRDAAHDAVPVDDEPLRVLEEHRIRVEAVGRRAGRAGEGGVLTPAVALGDDLVEALRGQGFTLEIERLGADGAPARG